MANKGIFEIPLFDPILSKFDCPRVLGVSRWKLFDQLSIVYDVVFAGEFKYVLEIFVISILFLEIEVKVVKKTKFKA